MHIALAETEETYSGLTNGCATAGKAGCKLLEFTGENVTGDDVKTFLNYAHDVIDILCGPGNPSDPTSILS